MINNNNISVRQLQIMIVLQTLGTGIVMIPTMAQGRIAPLIGAAALDIAYCMLLCLLDNKSMYDIVNNSAGKVAAKSAALVLALFLTAYTGCCLNIFSTYVKEIIMKDISLYLLMGFFVIFASYGAYKGIEVLGRTGEILFLFILLPMLFVYLTGIRSASFSKISLGMRQLPLAFNISFCFSGAWLLLLTGGYVKGEIKKAVSAVYLADFLVIFVTGITTAYFGINYFTNQQFPVLEMMYSSSGDTLFLNRLEAVVMCFWISAVFLQLSYSLFFISDLLGRALDGKRRIFPAALAVFAAACFLNSQKILILIQKTGGILFLLVLPIIFIMMKGKGK